MMITINPKKLLNSKWTAVTPKNKEKHFIVVELNVDEDDTVIDCTIQAVMSKRDYVIDWRDLKNSQVWHQGWQ